MRTRRTALLQARSIATSSPATDGSARVPAFGNVFDPDWHDSALRGPDGMEFEQNCRLFVAVFGQKEVPVFDHDGTDVEHIQLLGKGPTNVAFGPAGQPRIYVGEYEHGRIEIRRGRRRGPARRIGGAE